MTDIKKGLDDLAKNMQKEGEIAELKEQNIELTREVLRLRKTLEEYGIEEEAHICNIETICQTELERYAELVLNGHELTEPEAKKLDLLHKNLRMARGKLDKKEVPGKAMKAEDLLKIVKNETK